MRWFLWGIHLSQWWFVWNGSRYETSQLATAATGQTTGAAREWLLWLVTACLVITPFILCSPHPKQIRSCSMWCIIYQSIPKELRFWNKTWIIYQHLERGRWLLRLLIITSRFLLKEVLFLYFYKEDKFKKHLLKMIMMLYNTTQLWFSQTNAMAWFDCWFNHQEQQFTGRIEREKIKENSFYNIGFRCLFF